MDIVAHYENAKKRIERQCEDKRSEILKQCRQIQNSITDYTKNAKFSRFAIADFHSDSLKEMHVNENLPEFVRIGKLSSVKQPGLTLPYLLPFTTYHATAFMADKAAHKLMELLAFRLMLSLPRHLGKFYLLDNNFGRDFAHISHLKENVVDMEILTDNRELDRLLLELEKTITVRNREYLTEADSLTEYNQRHADKKEPYYFVFISNLSAGMPVETAGRMYKVINDGNACKAGIYMFLSINMENGTTRDLTLRQILSTVTVVNGPDAGLLPERFWRNFTWSSDAPDNLPEVMGILNGREAHGSVFSFEEEYKQRFNHDDFWKKQTVDGLKIPLGFLPGNQVQYLEWGKRTNNYFGLIGGLPGTGKTVLLHNIILWGAMEYSPLELQYYLIDCKNGTGMNAYKDLPHTKILSSSTDRSFSESVFNRLIDEMRKRAELFKKASMGRAVQIENIHTYRRETGSPMARILVIIDEFQVLFEKEDRICMNIGRNMDKIFREGRAFGIHVLLCSQGIKRIYNLNINNVTWRLAFKLQSQDEALRILGNDAPLHLSKVGNAIINTSNGDKTANIDFQVGNVTDIYHFIKRLKTVLPQKCPDFNPSDTIVSDGNPNGKIENNAPLANKILHDAFTINDRFCDVFIGEPMAIREKHAFIRIRKQACSNVLIIGNDLPSAISIIGMFNYQLAKQSSGASRFYIVDCFNIDNPFSTCFEFAEKYFSNFIIQYSKNITKVIDEIDAGLTDRMVREENGEKTTGRIVLSIVFAQGCRNLRREGYNESPASKKLRRILKDGPDFGIHVLLHSLNYQGYNDMFNSPPDAEFENRIALDNNDLTKRIIAGSFGAEIRGKRGALLQAPEEIAECSPDSLKVYAEFNTSGNAGFVHDLMNIVNAENI